MSGGFVGVLQQLAASLGPYFLRNPIVGRFLQSFALTQDTAVQELADGLRLTDPLQCDASALPVRSRDRGIRIYDTEPEASKRLRLSQWWQLRALFGTHIGEMRNLRPFFLPSTPRMRIVHQDGAGASATWWTLEEDNRVSKVTRTPSNFDYDGSTAEWSRDYVVIYTDHLSLIDPSIYDNGESYDSGILYDGGPTAAQIRDIVSAIKEAQGPHYSLGAVIMTPDPTSFDPLSTATTDPDGWTSLPVGNWGMGIDPDTGLITRPPFASWIYEATDVPA